jgi:hypothetical protein
MRNRIWALLFCVHCLGLAAFAQVSQKRQVVLQVSNGAFVSFKSETSAIDDKHISDSQSLASLIHSQALTDENFIVHRVLTDSERRVIFGYDLWVNPNPVTRTFSLAVLPADEVFRRTFLKESALKSTDPFATFPNSTKPQTLDDGDAIELELLVNATSGVKIVDIVRVTFDRSTLFEKSLVPPKDFTLDAVALSVKSYELFVDGTLMGKGKSTVGCRGALLWFYLPERGRFIFSLVPREGYAFRKSGILEGNRIEFVANGRHYEWVSGAPILPNGGTWNLWVLQDPNYSPLFGPEKPMSSKSPGVMDKLSEVLVLKGATGLTVRVPGSAENPPRESKQVEVPQRMMVGGADSMDHLLPKSP